jgi:ribosomal protein L37AE/L43A
MPSPQPEKGANVRLSRSTRVEEATAKEGVCRQCGRTTTVHWSAVHTGWRCRECNPARVSAKILWSPPDVVDRGQKKEKAEDLGDYDLSRYEDGTGREDE